jgi:hypothetical protein
MGTDPTVPVLLKVRLGVVADGWRDRTFGIRAPPAFADARHGLAASQGAEHSRAPPEVDVTCPTPGENTLCPSPCPLLIRIFPLDEHR